jgi:hypothetical protein
VTLTVLPGGSLFGYDANPWALHGIAERLLEALRQVYLKTKGDLEGEKHRGPGRRSRRTAVDESRVRRRHSIQRAAAS